MSPIAKILGIKAKYEIKYRWKVEGAFTGWTTYKKFKSKKKFQEELEKIKDKSSEFVEYQVVA